MTGLESNIFAITNLSELSSVYRLYKIRGLGREHPQYYQNRQAITRKLSYSLKKPVTVVECDGYPRLVVPDDSPEPPSPFHLVRTVVYFDPIPGTRSLDYTVRNEENDAICLRFLQFIIQAPLNANARLWQPGSGQPFFEKTPAEYNHALSRYAGFSVRVLSLPSGRLGLCVDVCNKIVSTNPLPIHLSLPEFRGLRGRHCIYRFGHKWYEIQLRELSDLNASEFLIPVEQGNLPILEYISAQSQKPIPQELANMPHDASVVLYMNNQEQLYGAASGLCYLVQGTSENGANIFHSTTILKPHERRAAIHSFFIQYLKSLRFGACALQLSPIPEKVPPKMFLVPDYEFGHSYVLSTRGTPSSQQVSLDQVGRTRSALLRDRRAGFYVKDRLDRQYLILPQTVADSFGTQFVSDLRRSVDDLFPEGQYDPIIGMYNDRGPRTFVEQGKAILESSQKLCTKPGYAMVMIHHANDRLTRQHDQLAAMVVREFRKLDVCAAVNHSTMAQECYELIRTNSGQPLYRIREDKKSRFLGYLRGVSLNKILLTNERWPFVLSTSLHADLTVGIDVKHHTAGFTIVGQRGSVVRTICKESTHKEQLSPDLIKKYLLEVISKEAADSTSPVKSIVIHRDGRLWEAERPGIHKTMVALRADGIISPEAQFAVLEIPKSSWARFRLFDVTENGRDRWWVENPQVGCHWLISQNEAYVCSTGRAFPRRGTVRPLHVRYVDGQFPFANCLEDLYSLTTLTWTRPEDCTRYPITIKLTDRRLGEDASEYDVDALEFKESEPEEEPA
jgi:hypothetical protein